METQRLGKKFPNRTRIRFLQNCGKLKKVQALTMLEAEAKERERIRKTKSSTPEKIPESSKGDTRDKAAKIANVNPRATVKRKRARMPQDAF